MPWISASSMKQKSLCDSALKLSEKGVEYGARLAEPGDVLILVRGSELHNSIPVGIATRQVAYNQDIKALRCNSSIKSEFLYYWLKAMEGNLLNKVESTGIGAGKIDTDVLSSLEVPVPDLSEQSQITAQFKALDDKIELNRRMNETLEQMAKALFKSWFVDFDPVHAKAAGRQPAGMDRATADLFPDSFVDSEMGKVPKGWEVSELGQIADVIDCLHAKKPEASETGQLYLQLNNIRDDGLIDISETFLIGLEDYKKWTSRMEATEGDCVITNVGRVGAVAQIPQGMKAALGRNITGIRCKPIFTNPTFLIECLMSEEMREEIRRKTDTGTILDALNVKSIPKLRFIRPPSMITERFERLARPLRHQMERGVSQSRTLADLRDTLLHKLLSGDPTKTSHK